MNTTFFKIYLRDGTLNKIVLFPRLGRAEWKFVFLLLVLHLFNSFRPLVFSAVTDMCINREYIFSRKNFQPKFCYLEKTKNEFYNAIQA